MIFNAAKLAELTAQINSLQSQLTAATEGQAAISAQLATAEADKATLQAQALDLQAKVDAANAALATANTNLAAAEGRATAAEASVNDKVTAALAAAGVDPVKRDTGKVKQDGTKPVAKTEGTPVKRAAAAMATSWRVFSAASAAA